MRIDHDMYRSEQAAQEYWTRIHRGEPREDVLFDVAATHGITHRELRAAIGRYALQATSP